MLNPKELIKLQQEAKRMQKQLRAKKITGESKDGSVQITLNGAQEFEDIYISDDLLDPEEFRRLKEKMKEAFKDFQKKLSKNMAQDMDLDQLKNMLG